MADNRNNMAQANDHCIIACMGPTGSGKSSFISLINGIDAKVGHTLVSETQTVQVKQTTVDGTHVTLVDTPGFDDTHNSDAEVLRLIADYLQASFQEKVYLTGIIYFHRITDNRVGGVNAKNLRLFQSLVGDDALSHVFLCTTMWDELQKQEQGERREKELRANFWKKMVDNGSSVVRHANTPESALSIVRQITRLRGPVVLELQDQLVNKGIPLADTGAGKQLSNEILAVQAAVRKEMESLMREMETANGRKLDQLKEEWQQEAQRLRQSQVDQAKLLETRDSEIAALRSALTRKRRCIIM